MDVIEMLWQEYKDIPETYTRINLVARLIKEVVSLEESYKNKPQTETRKSLIRLYLDLKKIACEEAQHDRLTKIKKFSLRLAELCETDIAENPSFEARRSLSKLYRSIIFITDTTEPDTYSEIKQLYLKKLPLDEANYSEKHDKETFAMLANTYYSLAEAILSENAPDAIAEAEKWLMTDLSLRDEYFEEHPGSHYAKMTLVHGYHRLSQLEKRKGTPESKEKSSMWQKKINETINKPLKK